MPTIVVAAFNRPQSLNRLLGSLTKCNFAEPVKLIISIDGSDNELVKGCADFYDWKFGEKLIIAHGEHLGLKEHILRCGDLVNQEESIILLEDDIWVSPFFYEFAVAANNFYTEDSKVAGISLYNYQKTEYDDQFFIPVDDGSDCYFMQVPSSWGQVFNKKGWNDFREWLSENEAKIEGSNIPEQVKSWGAHSWKKHFMHFLVDTDKYFVFPRLSLSTNFEDLGTNSDSSGKYQVTTQSSKRSFNFFKFDDSKSIYDAWFEIKPVALNKLIPWIADYSYDVDLNGYKQNYHGTYLLTSKPLLEAKFSFSSNMKPAIQNIITELPGNSIHFGPAKIADEEIISGDLERIFVIVPMPDVEHVRIKKQLDSMVTVKNQNIKFIICVNSNHLIKIQDFLTIEYTTILSQTSLVVSNETGLDFLTKEGLNKIKTGIVTWLHPDYVLSKDILETVAKVFADIRQINAVTIPDSREKILESRITKNFLLFNMKRGKAPFLPDPVFFRGHFYQAIADKMSKKRLTGVDFSSQFLFELCCLTDILPVISGRFTSSQKTFGKPSPQNSEMYKSIVKDELGGISGSLKFRILKWLAQKNIFGFRNLFYISYPVPLIVHCELMKQKAYLYNM